MNIAVGVYARGVRGVMIAFAAAWWVGCGASSATLVGPEASVSALSAALRAGDAAAIARLTGRSEPEALAALGTAGDELRALGATLGGAPLERDASVYLADGDRLALTREGAAWRVDRGVLGRPSLARPVDAVLALHDALVRSRLEDATSLLSRTARSEVETELGRWIAGTADPDALEIQVAGEAAVVTTPLGDRIDLVRESGQWRIVELR